MSENITRCFWCTDDPIYMAYHDEEWGRPLHDDQKLFEMLILEGAQAGLSWITILKRRQGYREVFDHFDATIIANYSDEMLEEKLKDTRIIRNRLKVFSVRTNAIAFLNVVALHGSFNDFIWSFTGGIQIHNHVASREEIPVTSIESDAMSKALKKLGFKFIGSTICYAYMQAIGMVNDHTSDCFLYNEKSMS